MLEMNTHQLQVCLYKGSPYYYNLQDTYDIIFVFEGGSEKYVSE